MARLKDVADGIVLEDQGEEIEKREAAVPGTNGQLSFSKYLLCTK